MYKVGIGSNNLWRRHVDQIRESNLSLLPEPQPDIVQTQIAPNVQVGVEQPMAEPHVEKAVPVTVSTPKSSHVVQQAAQSVKSEKPVQTERRYPLRIRKPPKCLEL